MVEDKSIEVNGLSLSEQMFKRMSRQSSKCQWTLHHLPMSEIHASKSHCRAAVSAEKQNKKTFLGCSYFITNPCYLALSYSMSKHKNVIVETRDAAWCLSLNKTKPQGKSVWEKINDILQTYTASFWGTFSDLQLSPREVSDDHRIQNYCCKPSDAWLILL